MTDQPAYDQIAAVNRKRWNRLVEAGVAYTTPWLDLTPEIARTRLDPYGAWARYVVDGVRINRYGYLSDEKLDIIRAVWR